MTDVTTNTDPQASPIATGRVVQVNISAGGVPKRPVPAATVSGLGLDGDVHRSQTSHGGPHRAVCLFGLEAIERVASDGHPIEPGAVGENLTTEGIEWSELAVGARVEVGRDVVLELSGPANPCDTIVGAFRRRRSGRISILRFPSDSRMYARVLSTGVVRENDPIRVLPPLGTSLAPTHHLLDVLDAVESEAYLGLWSALAATGRRIEILDRGELRAASSPDVPSSVFNRAFGQRNLPHLVERLTDLFRRTGQPGWIVASPDPPPWPGASVDAAEGGSDVFHAPLQSLATDAGDPSVRIRQIGPDEAVAWADIVATSFDLDPVEAAAWRDLAPGLARTPGEHLVVAERGGRAVGAAALFTRRRTGLLAAAAVLPGERGQGVHAALIAGRIAVARGAGATQIMATASTGGASARNLARAGLRPIWPRVLWQFNPAET